MRNKMQRSLSIPAFLFQFNPIYNELIGLTESFQKNRQNDVSLEKQKQSWIEGQKNLDKKIDKKELVTAAEVQAIHSNIERLKWEVAVNDKAANELMDRISWLYPKLYTFFEDIFDDYEMSEMNLHSYKEYLSKYQKAIEASNGLPLFKGDEYPKIKESNFVKIKDEIEKYLPAFKKAA